MAGTFGLKAATLSLTTLQMLLWATFPELSKTREAFWMAVPSLGHGEQRGRDGRDLNTGRREARYSRSFLLVFFGRADCLWLQGLSCCTSDTRKCFGGAPLRRNADPSWLPWVLDFALRSANAIVPHAKLSFETPNLNHLALTANR